MTINKQALREKIARKRDISDSQTVIDVDALEALLDELEAAERRLTEVRGYNVDLAEESRQYQQMVAELEARELVVNLPAYVDGRTLGYGEVNHMIDLCADAIEKAGHAAGIITKVGG